MINRPGRIDYSICTSQAQYVFIYDALLDAVICGNTEATAHDIAAKLRYLDQQSHDTPETYLMQEFKVLNKPSIS